jgi:aquaglyceroporin related protein
MAPGQPQTAQQGNVYVEPEYRQRNPKYGRENEKPIWGLAKPLPRVVRPGMRRDQKSQSAVQESDAPGESSAAPELGATPGLASSQSTGAPQGQGQTYSSTAQQGVAKQNAVYAPQADGLLRPMESEATMPHDPSQPSQQMDEQPQEEFLNLWVKIRHHMKEPFAEFIAVSSTAKAHDKIQPTNGEH